MTVYGFSDKRTAMRLKSMAGARNEGIRLGRGAVQTPKRTLYGSGWYVLTPNGGIPARSGVDFGSAVCELYYIAPDDKRTPIYNSGGGPVTATVYNETATRIPGNSFRYAESLYGKPFITSGPGSTTGAMIMFRINDLTASSGSISASVAAPSGSASESEAGELLCDSLRHDAPVVVEAHVIGRPCGSGTVAQEDADGNLLVWDESQSFLCGRERGEIAGKVGFATYMEMDADADLECSTAGSADENTDDHIDPPISGSVSASASGTNCKWVITWIDWFREKQVLQDWYVNEADQIIVEEFLNISVWDHCRLPDEITEGIDCVDVSGYVVCPEGGDASGSGAGSGSV